MDGDQRDPANRVAVSSALGISDDWARVKQVHGNRVIEIEQPGPFTQPADALFTKRAGLPVAVLSADCVAVVMGGAGGVGVAHAGWRGTEAGVVTALKRQMRSAGIELDWAAIGPFIESCCFEVGSEVAIRFPGHISRSRRGRTSVDLGGAIKEQLEDLPTWWSKRCTLHQPGSFSYRRDQTSQRMAAVGWIAP